MTRPKRNELIKWIDPDEGQSSGIYFVTELCEDYAELSNGFSEVQAPYSEIWPLTRLEAFDVTIGSKKDEKGKTFPNGFDSWMETHHEVVSAITIDIESGQIGRANDVHEEKGTGGIYELAEELTDKFEQLTKGIFWDGEFFETIETFLDVELHNVDQEKEMLATLSELLKATKTE